MRIGMRDMHGFVCSVSQLRWIGGGYVGERVPLSIDDSRVQRYGDSAGQHSYMAPRILFLLFSWATVAFPPSFAVYLF